MMVVILVSVDSRGVCNAGQVMVTMVGVEMVMVAGYGYDCGGGGERCLVVVTVLVVVMFLHWCWR